MTDCITSFQESLLDAYKYVDERTLQFKDGLKDCDKGLQSRKGGVVSQESARCLRDLLPVFEENLLCHCFLEFK